ncbi:hypothetical protein D3C76_1846160 [compost metagenome]
MSRMGDRISPATPKADMEKITNASIRKAEDTPMELPVIFGSSSCLTISTTASSINRPMASEVLPTMNK